MSSLAAARADNFYFPPDWNPNDQGGKGNDKKKKKPPGNLGARAAKQDQGILVIRFEMPFNVWCSGCNHMIAKGVRFNAEKKAVGKYFSTTIWSFSMRSACCQHEIEVHTDPKACEYIIVKGATRKTEEFSAADAETVELQSRAEVNAMRADPFARLETGLSDAQRARALAPTIAELTDMQRERSKDDYSQNKALRRTMRAQRKAAQALEAEHRALNLPEHIPLLAASQEDEAAARAVNFGPANGRFDANRSLARRGILAAPLLPAEAAAGRGTAVVGGPAARAAREAAEKRARLLAQKRQMELNGVRFGGGGAGKRADLTGLFGATASRVIVRPAAGGGPARPQQQP